MKLRSFALACVFALGAVPAVAADLPARMVTKAPAMAPAFSWTGLYSAATSATASADTTGTGNAPGNYDIDGVVGGGQIGANYQFGNWVFGVEADYQWADINGSGTRSLASSPTPKSRASAPFAAASATPGIAGWCTAPAVMLSRAAPLLRSRRRVAAERRRSTAGRPASASSTPLRRTGAPSSSTCTLTSTISPFS